METSAYFEINDDISEDDREYLDILDQEAREDDEFYARQYYAGMY